MTAQHCPTCTCPVADPCEGLHKHYTGADGANVWTVFDGPGHGWDGPGLFTATHAEVADYVEAHR